MHITDWLPTLISAAGGSLQGVLLDGVDQWSALVEDTASRRTDVLLQYDEVKGVYAARKENWKITNGMTFFTCWRARWVQKWHVPLYRVISCLFRFGQRSVVSLTAFSTFLLSFISVVLFILMLFAFITSKIKQTGEYRWTSV
jgi:hypothetical protein